MPNVPCILASPLRDVVANDIKKVGRLKVQMEISMFPLHVVIPITTKMDLGVMWKKQSKNVKVIPGALANSQRLKVKTTGRKAPGPEQSN